MAEEAPDTFMDFHPEPQSLVVDQLQKWGVENRPTGYALMGQPGEMSLILDYTGLRGSGANVYWSLIFWGGKARYAVRKVDEWMEINPNYTEIYNQLVGQRQRIEGAIKSSLGSVAQAVADYELLKHDSRRYREIIDYFKKGQKDQHVLRSLFVDRVDAFTGEGYSLVTMAKRWPSIITDFIRMKDEWEDVDMVKKELDVSQAEATVLKTKNELYKEWKTLFLPTVKERYARIETLVKARQRSIDEYKTWLKPYLAKYKAMKEATEGTDTNFYTSSAFATPGFGTMNAHTSVRLWMWRPFLPVEGGKPEAFIEKKGEGFVIDPYDDFARGWKGVIEKHYNVKISDKEVRDMLKSALVRNEQAHCSLMEPQALYYILFDIKIVLATIRSPPPEGVEMDNIMFLPIKIWVMSQNCLLIHMLEIKAREKWLEKYMDELIGARSVEQDIYKKVEAEFGEKKEEEKKEEEGFFKRNKPKYTFDPESKEYRPSRGMRFVRFFVKPGPYEPVFFERVSKMYMRASGFYFKGLTDHLKKTMGIE